MAEATPKVANQTTTPDRQSTDQPLPTAGDPGGAHRKGYSAESAPAPPVKEDGPLPLASDADIHAHAQKPDQSQAVQPSTPGGYSPNNRLTGADR